MTLDDAKQNLAAKREQLIVCRDGLADGNAATFHARTIANGRIAQIEMDIRTLDEIEI